MFVINQLKKMAATFFTDRNSNRKQMSKDKSCNLRQIRSRSLKEVRYGSNQKKESTFPKRSMSTNKISKISQSKPTKQTKLDDYLISMVEPLKARNLLENAPILDKGENLNSPSTVEDLYNHTPAPSSLQKQSPNLSSPSRFSSPVGGVSDLLSSMAANFRAVNKTGCNMKSSNSPSTIFAKSSKSPSPPLLTPSISPKAASSFYG